MPSLAGTRAADQMHCCLQTPDTNKCGKLSSAMVFYAMVSVLCCVALPSYYDGASRKMLKMFLEVLSPLFLAVRIFNS